MAVGYEKHMAQKANEQEINQYIPAITPFLKKAGKDPQAVSKKHNHGQNHVNACKYQCHPEGQEVGRHDQLQENYEKPETGLKDYG